MEGKEWNREDPECQEAIRKRKRNRAAKAAWVSSKKAGKAIVKALWWSIIFITAFYGLGRGISWGITDGLAENGKITVLTVIESQKTDEEPKGDIAEVKKFD